MEIYDSAKEFFQKGTYLYLFYPLPNWKKC